MKHKEKVSVERLRKVLSYDAETGSLTWLDRDRTEFSSLRAHLAFRSRKLGRLAGCRHSDGCTVVRVDGHLLKAHRVAWALANGSWPTNEIDHINGVRSDNRRTNLRDVTREVNQQNVRRAHRDSRLGILGVTADPRGGFRAQITINRRHYFIGHFDTVEEAHAAYVAKKREAHQGCTL